MSWFVEIDFVRSTFDASSVRDNGIPEWPPHPARLFNAFVDAASQDDDPAGFEALRCLESLSPPVLVVHGGSVGAEAPVTATRFAYVPTNQHTTDEGGVWKTAYPARVAKGPRAWPRTAGGSRVVLQYAEPIDPAVFDTISRLAKLIAYLGRSTTPVVVCCSLGDATLGPADVALVASDDFGGIEVSVPRPGYADDLRRAWLDQRPAHEVARRWVSYAPRQSTDDTLVSPFAPPLVLGLARPIDPRTTLLVTGRLRSAMERALDPAPAVLNGHAREGDAPPRHQVALVPLASHAGEHPDGLVRGLGVVMPRSVAAADRAAVLAALGQVPEIHLGRMGVVRFSGAPRSLVALRPSWWSRPSTTWTTVTPLVADRYLQPTDEAGWREQVRRSCAHVDLPDPAVIEIDQVPWAPGALRAASFDTRRPLAKDPARAAQRRAERPRPAMHVRVQFPEPVRGPVLLGNLRYYGLGWCMPLTVTEEPRHD